MVEVFKTNVQETLHADQLVAVLQKHFPAARINFDLHDCDKILRMEGHDIVPSDITTLIQAHGFNCHVLE